MRSDMFKVIVERPRRNASGAGNGRPARALEDLPAREGIRRAHRDHKELNENLAPLRRYLNGQVGRPWNKVYAEIRAGLDARNVVQQHILQHLDQFIATRTRLVEGVVVTDGRYAVGKPLDRLPQELYVHPVTGLVLHNKHYRSWRRRRDTAEERKARAGEARRRSLDDHRQLHLLKGVWYLVEVRLLPDGGPQWDVVRKKDVVRRSSAHLVCGAAAREQSLYGRADLYAVAKRQLSERELRRHGLK